MSGESETHIKMSRQPDQQWYFEDNLALKDAFISLVTLDGTFYSFTGGDGKECSVYYQGQVLYKIEVQENGKSMKLEFNMGHFRFWDGNNGRPKRANNKLAPDFATVWDETWQNIGASLQPELDSALKACASVVSINLTVKEYAEKERERYLAHKDDPTTWKLTAKIKTAQDAKKFMDQFVPLLTEAVAEFQKKLQRNERKEAQRLQNHCTVEEFIKCRNEGKAALFFSDCEYNLPDAASSRLMSAPSVCTKFCSRKFLDEHGKDKGIGKPDGTGLFHWQGHDTPCLIEIKYDDEAIGGDSGICKHLRDMYAMAQDTEIMSVIRGDIRFALTKKPELIGKKAPEEAMRLYAGPEDALDNNNMPVLLFIMFKEKCNDLAVRVASELKSKKVVLSKEWPKIIFAIQEDCDRLALADYKYYTLMSKDSITTLVPIDQSQK